MQTRVEIGIRRFNAEQIPMRARLVPSAVRIFGLFAQTESDSEILAARFAYFPDRLLEEIRILFALDFAGLEHYIPVARSHRLFGKADYFSRVEPVASDVEVVAAYSAVEAVFRADVTAFDEAPQSDASAGFA